jgi:hypothetical protein
MYSKRLAMALAVLGTSLCLAAPASAQGRMMDDGWGMWGGRGVGPFMGMWDGRPGPWGRGPDAMLDRVDGRLAFIKTELKITEAQTPAWNKLAEAVGGAAKSHNERMRAVISGQERAKTAIERLDLQEQFMTIRLDEVKQIKGALKGLYDVLSEEQKKEADRIVLPTMGMHAIF